MTPYEKYMQQHSGPFDGAEIARVYRQYAWLESHAVDLFNSLQLINDELYKTTRSQERSTELNELMHDASQVLRTIKFGPQGR